MLELRDVYLHISDAILECKHITMNWIPWFAAPLRTELGAQFTRYAMFLDYIHCGFQLTQIM
jgi:hypothetical protein